MITESQHKVFTDNQFNYEYPDYWSRYFGNIEVTVSNGISCNGYLFEVQYQCDGDCVTESDITDEINQAVDKLLAELAQSSL
jgi:hypothetical protein